MRNAFLCAVIFTVGTVVCSAAQAPSSATIRKVFHEQRPLQSLPRLLKDTLGSIPINWQDVLRHDPRQKAGEYFKIAWTSRRASGADLKLHFEYRQKHIAAPQVVSVDVPQVAGAQLTSVTITDTAFQRGGPITAWRVSIVEGDRVLATKQSFLW